MHFVPLIIVLIDVTFIVHEQGAKDAKRILRYQHTPIRAKLFNSEYGQQLLALRAYVNFGSSIHNTTFGFL